MKIATWNIERLAHKNKLDDIVAACEHENADILVLTEADVSVKLPQYPFCGSTTLPQDHELPPYPMPVHYMPTERRVIIYSRYPCVKRYSTYDETTAICAELETERGNLLVYGAIIGIHGHRKPFFTDALYGQIADLKRLATERLPVCFLGDCNCSFADNYYPSNTAKAAIQECFAETGMKLLTAAQQECIDHIAISESFADTAFMSVKEWNCDKKLSDHKGIAVIF